MNNQILLTKQILRESARKISNNMKLFLLMLPISAILNVLSVFLLSGTGYQPGQFLITNPRVSNYNFDGALVAAITMVIFTIFSVRLNTYDTQVTLGTTRTSYTISNIVLGIVFAILFTIFIESISQIVRLVICSLHNNLTPSNIEGLKYVMQNLCLNFSLMIVMFALIRLISDIFNKNGTLTIMILIAFAIGFFLVSAVISVNIPQELTKWWIISLFSLGATIILLVIDYFVVTKGDLT